jgi:hypothetical protein
VYGDSRLGGFIVGGSRKGADGTVPDRQFGGTFGPLGGDGGD